MMESTSLTEELRHAISNNRSSNSPLFSIGGHQNLSYATCWNILHLHKKWLLNQAISLCHDCNDVLTTKRDSNNDEHRQLNKNEIIIDDVVIGYLADNSPDLLLSLLGCIDLTTRNNEQHDDDDLPLPLPAMINVRWTPLEIQQALRVHNAAADIISDGNDEKRHHVTILLYGEGYEKSAKEAVQLIKKYDDNQSHYAVAMPLPLFASDTKNHCSNNIVTTTSRNYHHCTSSNNDVPDSDALILFTSGTSSPNGAKGVRLSHRSLYIQAHAKTCPPCNYDKDTRLVATTVPWFHVGGISSALAIVLGGGCFVFPSSSADGDYNNQQEHIGSVREGEKRKGFDPDAVLQSLLPCSLSPSKQMRGESTTESIAANTLVVVPAMLHAMFQHQQSHLLPNNSVRLILVGGQSIGDKLYQQTREYFPKARIVQTYACTEAGSSITFLDLGYASTPRAGTAATATNESNDGDKQEEYKVADSRAATLVGVPPRHIEIGIFDAISDENNIVPLPQGQMGIIGTRGSHVMSGYWTRGSDSKRKERTQRTKDWMLTNDLGYINGRNLYFCGRANDVIRTGGESVLATEVEKVIITHPNVTECAVFALPDEKFGDAVCAALVLQPVMDNVAVREDDMWRIKIRKHCERHQLAGFKRPRRVFCMDALPRNSSGKVLKYEIVKACASYSRNRSRL